MRLQKRSLLISSLVLTTAYCFQSPNSERRTPFSLHKSSSKTSNRLNGAKQFGSSEQASPTGSSTASKPEYLNRRNLLKTAAAAATLTASLSISPAALAETTSTVTSQEILLRLRSIPTFCIVNSEGVPFMIFDGTSTATGYFFLSFDVAFEALNDARGKDKNAGAAKIWSGANIIVVPLAVALQLALRKTQRQAINNELKFDTFNDIVASEEGVDAAKEVETGNKEKWSQKGRVPIFYIAGLTLADGREPRYFNQIDLLLEWRRQHPDDIPPKVQITELVEMYRNALKKDDLSKISNVAIVPVKETNQVASKLMKSFDGPLPAYSLDKVYLVGSAKG